ncbi:Uncharacterised protein [Mycobacteroides abscessus subsp. abscessus]|nr:Uncharacterised protein [Mycobacteroides abscessus subsp. abscessus]
MITWGALVHGFEVGSGAEVPARTGQDADPDLRIVVDAVPGLRHDLQHFPGQGVACVRTIHRHDEDVIAEFHQGVRGVLLGHGVR